MTGKAQESAVEHHAARRRFRLQETEERVLRQAGVQGKTQLLAADAGKIGILGVERRKLLGKAGPQTAEGHGGKRKPSGCPGFRCGENVGQSILREAAIAQEDRQIDGSHREEPGKRVDWVGIAGG